MFFSGDPSTRKRVDLGGRSSKERDRQKLLEQTRLERNRRLWLRQQNSAALKIQKCFRGRKEVETERSKVRENFLKTHGERCHTVDRQCFSPDSDFLRHLLFFFNPTYTTDVSVLVETCRLLLKFVRDNGDVVSLFAGTEYASKAALVRYRVKKFAHACIRAVYGNRNKLRDQLFMESEKSCTSAILLLDAVTLLIDLGLPWACSTVTYLLQRNIYSLFREIILIGKDRSFPASNRVVSSFERVLGLITSHIGQGTCTCPSVDPQCFFPSQILTIPFLWRFFPHLKETILMSSLLNIAIDLPGYACLLGNLLEVAGLAFAQPESFTMAVDFATVATFLLEALPSLQSSNMGSREISEDEMVIDDEQTEKVLNLGLEQQITNAIDPRFLLQLTTVLLGGFSPLNGSHSGQLEENHIAAVTAVCAFLHATFNILPLERIMTVLAYRTELVPVLWNFMKQCHENQKWSSLSEQSPYLPADAPGWLLPLSVFCPVYKHMLMIVDNEEFYEQEKPLSLKDIRCLIVILRQALWQLLWLNPTVPANCGKSTTAIFAMKKHPLEFLQHRVCVVASELLSQLQDWNNRRQFTLPSEFHADGVNEYFISQAMMENTRANDILKQAPFLVPFTSRAKIFTSQLAEARQRNGSQGLFARHRFRIRRDHILEDAFNQLNALSEEDLRGLIRVTFVNELGVEEAGIDGGGIFKDFMENITRAAFDVQYGLFKAMFEGILVDIPFATFFLSKLKQKYNYLNDLPSLDPELYRHLIFLKHYEGDVSDLELYFVILNNEYGEQTEDELLPGGKSTRVTNENVITFIHLVANHRLNFQIRQQSSHFLRGFQQLIQKEWIDMFNEHELQLLISGSLDGIDIDDLRAHTNYTGGYHKEHYVIDMFWEVVKNFSLENQRKFLKAGGHASDEALDRLPTSATCMNLLKFPPYRSKEQMEQKLLYAINADAGFDLS
ncbi:hypothetical protein H5410_003924 [Solanum commersonii]|uniref:HECT-type E3 ubiquitin transferase n=1 Tax=Solanum commersonii TaxID=4109 RepID=A0A9J6B709_SOLCO|nr:hypothetical protein H5410_003924 [Solanum commersonii]